jgi:hypothetical protein
LKNFTFFLYNPYCFTKVVIFNVPEEIVILLNLIRPHPYLPIAIGIEGEGVSFFKKFCFQLLIKLPL